MPVKPIPEGYHAVTPYLIVKDAARAIDFYKHAFNGTELLRMPGPGGRIMHAELKLGDSVVMLADEVPEMGHHAPGPDGGAAVSLYLYVPDVDATVDRAVAAGAKVTRPVADQFYGDRNGTLIDPFGHVWSVGTHKEDVSPEEIERRMAAMTQKKTA
jgi:PhnB protein